MENTVEIKTIWTIKMVKIIESKMKSKIATLHLQSQKNQPRKIAKAHRSKNRKSLKSLMQKTKTMVCFAVAMTSNPQIQV